MISFVILSYAVIQTFEARNRSAGGPAHIPQNPAHLTDFSRTDIANIVAPIYIAELLLQRRTQTLLRFQI